MIGPSLYWAKNLGIGPVAHRGLPNIIYQDDVTPEEIEKIRMQDEVEMLAFNMSKQPGYGLVHKGRSGHGLGV